jgi:predicted kinase
MITGDGLKPRLVVVSGPPSTAKLATAWAIAAADPSLRFLHRDQVRVLFGRLLTEGHLTRLLADMALCLLRQGYGVVTAGQNLLPSDRIMWEAVAMDAGAELEWVVRT